ncbi:MULTISPECIES: hypothetical protein [unclassified Luteimonas]
MSPWTDFLPNVRLVLQVVHSLPLFRFAGAMPAVDCRGMVRMALPAVAGSAMDSACRIYLPDAL